MANITLEDVPSSILGTLSTDAPIAFSVFIESLDASPSAWEYHPVGMKAKDFATLLRKEWNM